MTTLRATGITLAYADRTVVNDVELTALPGQVTAIVGPNGAGKSTMLRILAGLVSPDSGKVDYDGNTDTGPTSLARVRAYLSPETPDDLDFTVQQVVAMSRHPWSTDTDSSPAVENALSSLELESLVGRRHSELSTGEARRTQLARVQAQDTPVWLLDEPTNGLDIAFVELVLGILRDQSDRGKTIVVVLHDLNSAARIADRVVVMASGRVVAAGEPEEVLTGEILSSVYNHPVEVLAHPLEPGILILPATTRKP